MPDAPRGARGGLSSDRVLGWGRLLQAIAQTGLSYEPSPYDAARYRQVEEIAHELIGTAAGLEPTDVAALFGDEVGHATPKLDVRGAVFRDGELLLVHEAVSGRWTLPGGWADVGESAGESAAREVREESGYTVEPVKLVALHDRERRGYLPHPWYTHKATFLCALTDPAAEPSAHDAEVLGVGFFPENGLPEIDENRTSRALLATCFAHAGDVTLPTEFD